jgi:hypothetical protein
VASSTFYPHVGIVRQIERDGRDPYLARFYVVDRFTEEDPSIPRTMLVDSYANVHPEDRDKGAPLYYGDEGLRPYYFVATDCNLSTLLGPANVSSASHVTSVWLNAQVVTKSFERRPHFPESVKF